MKRFYYYIINCRLFIFLKNKIIDFLSFIIDHIYNFIINYKLNKLNIVLNIQTIINLTYKLNSKIKTLIDVLYNILLYIYDMYKSYILQYSIVFIFFIVNLISYNKFLLYNLFFLFFLLFLLYWDIFNSRENEVDEWAVPNLNLVDQINLIFQLKDNGLIQFFKLADDTFIMDDLNKMENMLLVGRKNIINDVFLETNYRRIIKQVNEEKKYMITNKSTTNNSFDSRNSCSLQGGCDIKTDKELYIKNFDDFRDLRSSLFMDDFDRLFFLKLSILITEKDLIDELFSIKDNYSSKDLKINDFILKYYVNAKILMYYNYMFTKTCIDKTLCSVSIDNIKYNDFIKNTTKSKFFDSYDNIKDYNDVTLYLFNTDTNISILLKFKLFLDNFYVSDLDLNSQNIEGVYKNVFWSRSYRLNYYDEIANFYKNTPNTNSYLNNNQVKSYIDILKNYYSFSTATTNSIDNIANLSLVNTLYKSQNLATFDYTLKEDLIEYIDQYAGLSERIDNLKNSKIPYLYMNKDLTSDINYNDFDFWNVMLDYKTNVESEDFLVGIEQLINFSENRNKINYKFINYLADMYNKFFEVNINNTNNILPFLNYRSGLINLNSKLLTIDFYELCDTNSFPELWFSDYRDYQEFLSNNEIINDKIKSLNKLIELNYLLGYLDTEEIRGMYWTNQYIIFLKKYYYSSYNLNDKYLNLLFYDCFRFYFYDNLRDKHLFNTIDFNTLNNSIFYVKPYLNLPKNFNEDDLKSFNSLNDNYKNTYYKKEYSVLKEFFKDKDISKTENLNILESEIITNKNYKLLNEIPNINRYYIFKLNEFRGSITNNNKWNFIKFFDSIYNPFEFWEKLYFFNSNMSEKFKINKLSMISLVVDNINSLMDDIDCLDKTNQSLNYNKYYNNYIVLNSFFCSYINILTTDIYHKFSGDFKNLNKYESKELFNKDFNLFLSGIKKNNDENIKKIHSIEYEFLTYKELNLFQQFIESILNLNYFKLKFAILDINLSFIINAIYKVIDYIYMCIIKCYDIICSIYFLIEPILSLIVVVLKSSKLYNIIEFFFIYIKNQIIKLSNYINSIDYIYTFFLENWSFIIIVFYFNIMFYLLFISKNKIVNRLILKTKTFIASKIIEKTYIVQKNRTYILRVILNLFNSHKKINKKIYNNKEFYKFNIINLLSFNIKNIQSYISIIKTNVIVFYLWINKKYCYNFINNIIYYIKNKIKIIHWNVLNKNYSIYNYYINSRKNFKKNKNESYKKIKH